MTFRFQHINNLVEKVPNSLLVHCQMCFVRHVLHQLPQHVIEFLREVFFNSCRKKPKSLALLDVVEGQGEQSTKFATHILPKRRQRRKCDEAFHVSSTSRNGCWSEKKSWNAIFSITIGRTKPQWHGVSFQLFSAQR